MPLIDSMHLHGNQTNSEPKQTVTKEVKMWEKFQRTKLWGMIMGVASGDAAIFGAAGLDEGSVGVQIAMVVVGGAINIAAILGYIKMQGDIDKLNATDKE